MKDGEYGAFLNKTMLGAWTFGSHYVKLYIALLAAQLLSLGVCPAWMINSSASDTPCAHIETEFRCVKYVRNYDADTITVEIPRVHPLLGKNISVRVAHVDTPEIKGKLPCEKGAARNARRLVENFLKNAKRIDLVDVKRDKYFRVLADVVVDDKNLKDLLFKNGLAYAYEGRTKKSRNWCQRLPASERR